MAWAVLTRLGGETISVNGAQVVMVDHVGETRVHLSTGVIVAVREDRRVVMERLVGGASVAPPQVHHAGATLVHDFVRRRAAR